MARNMQQVGERDGEQTPSGSEGGTSGLQVVVLGPTGGPREDRVTGLLVRSTSSRWSANSVIAVDAGTLLCGVINILEQFDNQQAVLDGGPFSGLDLPFNNAPANAAHFFRHVIGAILITHPHLDHLSAFAINTPALEAGNGAKTIAALPSVVTAIKTHVFNDVIWPNLSDEEGGAGLVTYQRLREGGEAMLGIGDERGYKRVCEGLVAKCFGVSHGSCRLHPPTENDVHHRLSSAAYGPGPMKISPGGFSFSTDELDTGYYSPVDSPGLRGPGKEKWTTVESSVFFIRCPVAKREVMIFGDVEPDSISRNPRNKRVWEVAAPKIASGQLRAIFIECSYNDDVEDDYLYGHLCPRHLITELTALASIVKEIKFPESNATKKRKRASAPDVGTDVPLSPKSKRLALTGEKGQSSSRRGSNRSTRRHTRAKASFEEPDEKLEGGSPAVSQPATDVGINTQLAESSDPLTTHTWPEPPLAGLRVYVIHIKDHLTDGPPAAERILHELQAQGKSAGLGCEFRVPDRGESICI
ncbi:hypothetical protein BO86DRAFT_45917 [Aspergillus japonicus CBS 114.51]|uniref:cAMP-specific phosphodiesterase n=2 Tax=Aspergillus TaxID=5052 RepID=A0A2V5HF99_ASPV1|nr:hypothetical protein BO86DRAFT_45917 [Aspergillus japonicus CBS 114.51]PYI23015.1 hypothetical protein BO99DRAFT_222140 [Aspergillus violaceofuscus CBS 115571]RAH75829.1 hypothetical protein BO86DRAFT_45917 [Aspergillus japonicus CBS 114.51]